MSIDNPAAILVDVSGSVMAVTASLKIPAAATALLVAAVGADGTVRYFDVDSNRALRITGSVDITETVLPVTGTVALAGTPSVSISGTPSVSVSNFPIPMAVVGNELTGSTNSTRPLLIAGVDASGIVRGMRLDAAGATSIFVSSSLPVSSSGGTLPVAIQSAPQLQITGSVLVVNTQVAPVNVSGSVLVVNTQANPVNVSGSFLAVNPLTKGVQGYNRIFNPRTQRRWSCLQDVRDIISDRYFG